MTLRLINAYTSDNLGDAAIYETLVQLSANLGASTDLDPQRRRNVRGLANASAPVQAWVSVGGDIFNNARPRLVTRRFLQLVQELRGHEGRRSFVFGQGLPSSCQGLSLWWLAQAMKRLSSVTVRDTLSVQRLRAAGVQAELGFDTVFAYRCGPSVQAAGRALFERAQVRAERAVLFSVREFDAMYPQDGARFEARLLQLLVALRERGHEPALLIQAQAEGADSDWAVLDRLSQHLGHLPVLDPFGLDTQVHHPLDALIGAIAQASAVLAVRYHTAVLRMVAQRRPYNLYYSSKGRDLVERLGVPGMALEHFDPATVLKGLEDSMDQAYDPSSAAQTVREQFTTALQKALAS